jgi:hypothetical protein
LLSRSGVDFGQAQLDPGASGAERVEGAEQGFAERGGHHADAEGADESGVGLGGDFLGALRGGDQRAALDGERATGLGERDCAGAAVEQSDAELALQLQDGLAEGRLRHRQLLGGPTEMQGLRHGQEVTGLPDLDYQSLSIWITEEIRPSIYG